MKSVLKESITQILNFIIGKVIPILILILTFLLYLTTCKPTIPIEFGFNDDMVSKIELSTGHKAKAIQIRFKNTQKTTLLGVAFNIRFYRPLALSGTKHAIKFIQGETTIDAEALAQVAAHGESSKGMVVIQGDSNPKGSTEIGKKFSRGPGPGNNYYQIQPPEFLMIGNDTIDLMVEIDTQNLIAGKDNYKIGVTIYSKTQPSYERKEGLLSISMK